MATTRIIPLHTGKGRTAGRSISDVIGYVENPEKTGNGKCITGYQCDSRTADAEFLLSKKQYIQRTGRARGEDDVIAYQIRQSFVPGEIKPEEASRLGWELAKRFTKGNHAFIVCTHMDKAHIHNHIIWNAVNLKCDRKFRNFWGSGNKPDWFKSVCKTHSRMICHAFQRGLGALVSDGDSLARTEPGGEIAPTSSVW